MEGVGNASSQLECVRQTKMEDEFRDAVAFLAMQLVDQDQRELFRKCDGVVTIGRKNKTCLIKRTF